VKSSKTQGCIQVRSEGRDRGAEFIVRLPLDEADSVLRPPARTNVA
jgi:hypothetical protein